MVDLIKWQIKFCDLQYRRIDWSVLTGRQDGKTEKNERRARRRREDYGLLAMKTT